METDEENLAAWQQVRRPLRVLPVSETKLVVPPEIFTHWHMGPYDSSSAQPAVQAPRRHVVRKEPEDARSGVP